MAKKSLKYKKCKYSIKPNTQCAVIDTTTLKRWKHLQNKTTREKDFGWAYLHFPYHPVTRTKVLWWHFLRFFWSKSSRITVCCLFILHYASLSRHLQSVFIWIFYLDKMTSKTLFYYFIWCYTKRNKMVHDEYWNCVLLCFEAVVVTMVLSSLMNDWIIS